MIPSSGQNGLSRFERRSVRLPRRISSAIGGAPRGHRRGSRERRAREAGPPACARRRSPRRRASARPRSRPRRAHGACAASRRAATWGATAAEHRQQRLDVSVAEPDPTLPAQWSPSASRPAEDERAELRPTARPPREPDDREVVLLPELELLPLGCPPAGAVRRVGSLRDDALEALCRRRLEQRGAVLESGRQAHCVGRRVEDAPRAAAFAPRAGAGTRARRPARAGRRPSGRAGPIPTAATRTGRCPTRRARRPRRRARPTACAQRARPRGQRRGSARRGPCRSGS